MPSEENEAFPEPSKAVVEQARKDGIAEAIKETTKEAYKRGADEGYGEGAEEVRTFPNKAAVMQLLPVLDLGLGAFTDRIDEKAEPPLNEDQVAGLLEAERSGKNRTEYVKAMMKRLKVAHVYEVTTAGPAYTVDTTNITDL